MKKLDKKMFYLWLVRSILFIVCIVLPATIVLSIVMLLADMVVPTIILLCISIIIIILSIMFPIWKYRIYGYEYNDRKIIYRYGIIFHHEVVIPVIQIQDLHLYQGPLLQIFHLAGVIVSTAGSNYTIPGLSLEDANLMINQLEDNLNNRVKELENE